MITNVGFFLTEIKALPSYPPYMKVCANGLYQCPLCEIPLVYRPLCVYHSIMAIRYSDLEITTEVGAMCYPCREYKGMVDCPECGTTFCVFCEMGCPGCFEEILFV